METEKRKHPRAEICWRAVILAGNGFIDGRTENVSAGGVFIVCPKSPRPEDNFRLILKPQHREFLVATAEKIWGDTFSYEEGESEGMGVRFIQLSSEDQEFIGSMIAGYLEAGDDQRKDADSEDEDIDRDR